MLHARMLRLEEDSHLCVPPSLLLSRFACTYVKVRQGTPRNPPLPRPFPSAMCDAWVCDPQVLNSSKKEEKKTPTFLDALSGRTSRPELYED